MLRLIDTSNDESVATLRGFDYVIAINREVKSSRLKKKEIKDDATQLAPTTNADST